MERKFLHELVRDMEKEMRIYREKRDGKYADNWSIMLRDHTGVRRKFAAFRDKDATRTFGGKLEKLIDFRRAGRQLDNDLTEWLGSLPTKIISRLATHNVVDRFENHTLKPLMIAQSITPKFSKYETLEVTSGHLADYRRHLEAKERNSHHIHDTITNCAKIIRNRGWTCAGEVSTPGIEAYLSDMREGGASARWTNSALVAIKSFINWMIREERMPNNPAKRIDKYNENKDRRRKRRPLSSREISDLISAAVSGKYHHGLEGNERALIYRLALTTGLRYNEIFTLGVNDFSLANRPPSVSIRAENEKSGRGETLPLPKDLAADLVEYFIKSDGADNSQISLFAEIISNRKLAFPGMQPDKGADMLHRDLDAAGINWRSNEQGETVDFHSLRHTFGTMLAKRGVHPKVAQDLMRHSTINLTMNLYTHTILDDRAKATEGLLDLSGEDGNTASAAC